MKTRKPRPQREPLVKTGTTAHWQRPWCGTFELRGEVQVVDLLDVLVKSGMAQSNAEARRLIKQGRVWDADDPHGPVKLAERDFAATAGCRLIVGSPTFVGMGYRSLLDLTKGVIVLFVKKERKV